MQSHSPDRIYIIQTWTAGKSTMISFLEDWIDVQGEGKGRGSGSRKNSIALFRHWSRSVELCREPTELLLLIWGPKVHCILLQRALCQIVSKLGRWGWCTRHRGRTWILPEDLQLLLRRMGLFRRLMFGWNWSVLFWQFLVPRWRRGWRRWWGRRVRGNHLWQYHTMIIRCISGDSWSGKNLLFWRWSWDTI